MTRVYIGLGSNLGDPRAQVARALEELDALSETRLLARSSWYRSAAVGPGEQPDYINGVALLETQLTPEALLDELQALELSHQRVRDVVWGPRTLDLDILLYGNAVIDSERLQVPHPWLTRRNFVVMPLAELTPDLRLPDGTAVEFLLDTTSREGIERLAD